MPSRTQTIADAISIFENAEYPSGLTPSTAWLGIYQTLLWYEPINWVGFTQLPHIIDANELRPASPQIQKTWLRPKPWQLCAAAMADYLAAQLNCTVAQVPDKVDLLMKDPDYAGMQRQNSLGIAFAGLVMHILRKFGAPSVQYATEVYAADLFPNIHMPGRSATSRGDLIARDDEQPRAVISAKWSVRHDRVNDVTNECAAYRAAYEQVYGASGKPLRFYVVTNEYSPARLLKMLSDPCADGVAHVHKAAVTQVCGTDGRLDKLMDLQGLITATNEWV